MKKETEYDIGELRKGKCHSCGERGWLADDGNRCVDCIEDEKFYNESKGLFLS